MVSGRQKAVERSIGEYKNAIKVNLDEEKIMETINKSREVFYKKEQEMVACYLEFLWGQMKLSRKRWWFLQMLVLVFLGFVLKEVKEEFYIQRSMGIAGVLFVILVIPELWKNQLYNCMEIEASSYYSLRQIYSARILLFGIADVLMVTIFCFVLHGKMYFTLAGLMSQFIFPMAVTACICFGLLCNKYQASETVSIVSCLAWSAVWWLATVNGRIYKAVTLPVWTALLGIAFAFILYAIFKIINNCNKQWEVNLKWN